MSYDLQNDKSYDPKTILDTRVVDINGKTVGQITDFILTFDNRLDILNLIVKPDTTTAQKISKFHTVSFEQIFQFSPIKSSLNIPITELDLSKEINQGYRMTELLNYTLQAADGAVIGPIQGLHIDGDTVSLRVNSGVFGDFLKQFDEDLQAEIILDSSNLKTIDPRNRVLGLNLDTETIRKQLVKRLDIFKQQIRDFRDDSEAEVPLELNYEEDK